MAKITHFRAMNILVMQEGATARSLRAKEEQDRAYIKLNNLYLAIQRGTEKLTIHSANTLRCLATQAYPKDDKSMQDYWMREFQKLPRWELV